MPIKIAINGFGRIGRCAFKIMLENPEIQIVAINDLGSIENLAYLLKYDSAYGIYNKNVSFDESNILVEGNPYKVLSQKDPLQLPWKEMEVDVVLECTGFFVKDNSSQAHIEAGANAVVLSAPAKGELNTIKTFLKGVNHKNLSDEKIISNASCTTNCIAPVVEIVNRNFKILKSLMTTVHSYTASQNIVDGPNKDFREGRAGAVNMVPTSTGAAISTTQVIPELKGLFDGISIRVPTIVGSLSDITFVVQNKTTVEQINQVFVNESKSERYMDILGVTNEQLVSSDIIGSKFSAIVDLSLTRVIDGDLVKILAWYDNEWGYSNRLVEMALFVSK